MAHEHEVLKAVFTCVPVYDRVARLIAVVLSCVLMVTGENIKMSIRILFKEIIHGALIVLIRGDISENLHVFRAEIISAPDVDADRSLFFHLCSKNGIALVKLRNGVWREYKQILKLCHHVVIIILAGKITRDINIIQVKNLFVIHLGFHKNLRIGACAFSELL